MTNKPKPSPLSIAAFIRSPNAITPALLILGVLVLSFLARAVGLSDAVGEDELLTHIILQIMALALPAVFYCKLKDTGYSSRLKLRLFGLGKLPIIIFAFFAMTFGSIVLRFFLYTWGISDGSPMYDTRGIGVGQALYVFLAFALIPGIIEEFVFRGILMSEYEHFGGVASVLASALLFAMLRFSLEEFFVHFFIGMILAFVVFITRSVISAVVLHILYGAFFLFVEPNVWYIISYPPSQTIFIFIMTIAAVLFSALTLGESERLFKIYSADGEEPPRLISSGKSNPIIRSTGKVLLSPAFLACVVVFIAFSLA
ncbi:MAG: CPBP family intramembrane metalloprotease [Oscillospiraceae bacterium]|nr:CPBP family intramembrane metalloprotease [Oscillospiraceae bacterium]